MWTAEISIDELRAKGRWKVEFFYNAQLEPNKSAFELVSLSEILQERRGTLNPQNYPDLPFIYLGLENVESLTGDLVDFEPRPGKEIKSVSKVFYRGDILYGRLRPYLNKVHLAEGPVSSGICSGEFLVLTPDVHKVLPNFLRTAMSSHYVQQYVRNLQTGSALPRLAIDDLLAMRIPLPPIEVQRKYEEFLIAEQASRQDLVQRVRDLPQAILKSVMLAVEEGSENVELGILEQSCIEYNIPLPQGVFEKQRRKRGA